MKYFTKEKDTFLKVVNSVLIVGFVFSIIIAIATGIQILNREPVSSYKDYAKNVCTIDQLEYECTDDSCIKELDTERKKTCTTYYLEYKKEQKRVNKTNTNNFFISLASSIVLFIMLHMLNKKI